MQDVPLAGPRGLKLRCAIADRGRDRLEGLLGRRGFSADEALFIPNATSVHTVGMRFPILIVRLDEVLRIVDVRRVPPWRIVWPIRRGRHVLECHPEVDLRIGDEVRIG